MARPCAAGPARQPVPETIQPVTLIPLPTGRTSVISRSSGRFSERSRTGVRLRFASSSTEKVSCVTGDSEKAISDRSSPYRMTGATSVEFDQLSSSAPVDRKRLAIVSTIPANFCHHASARAIAALPTRDLRHPITLYTFDRRERFPRQGGPFLRNRKLGSRNPFQDFALTARCRFCRTFRTVR